MSEEIQKDKMKEEEKTPTAAPMGQSKVVKYVVIAIVVLVVLKFASGIFFGAMGNAAVNAGLRARGVEVTGNPATGNATYNYKDDKGIQVTIGASAKLPDDFPSDVPLYKGNILSSTSATQDGKKVFSVSLQTSDAFDQVVSFYKTELVNKGWKITQEANVSAGYTMIASEKDTQALSVMLQNGDDGKTTIVLTTEAK